MSRSRPGSVLLLALLLAALLLGLPPGPSRPAGAAEAPLPTGPRLEVELTSLAPATAVPGAVLQVTGTVRNTGVEPVREPVVRLRLSRRPLLLRGDVAAIAAGASSLSTGVALPGTEVELGGRLAAGEALPFELSYPVDDLRLGPFGVYPLSVEVGSRAGGGFDRRVVLRTFLPWVPAGGGFQPTPFVWLWPLADAPRRDAAGVFTDDGLAGAMAPGGRLARLVAAADGPLTWVVDPVLVEEAAAMADGYQVRAGSERVPGRGAAEAAAWLETLRARAPVGATDVVALPYARVDAAALLGNESLAVDVRRALRLGPRRLAELLGRPVTGRVAWPPGGTVEPTTARGLVAAGARTLLLSEAALPPLGPTRYTPDAREELDLGGAEPTDVVLYDERLSALAAAPPEGPGGAVATRQRFLAETAMITAELPNAPRTVVVAPPPQWDPPPGHAEALLAWTAAAPWLAPTTLGAVQAGSTLGTEPVGVDRAPLAVPAAPQRPAGEPLPPGHLAAVRALRTALSAYARVLTDPDPAVDRYSRAALRLESVAWRDAAAARRALLDVVTDQLAAELGGVRLIPSSITLGGSSGHFPVTVVNELDQPVQVSLELDPRQPRLVVGDVGVVTVEPGMKKQLLIPARARANGLVTVDAQLTSPDGRPIGPPVQLRVRVAQYGLIVAWVTGAIAGVLFLAALRRLLRRFLDRRRSRSGGPPPAAPPAQPAGVGAGAASRADRHATGVDR